MNAYITIGNSDNKLSQEMWSYFIRITSERLWLLEDARYGEWFSAPNSPFQNASWCIQIGSTHTVGHLRQALRELAGEFDQDSIALTIGETELVEPNAR